jgi:hypothetical protein
LCAQRGVGQFPVDAELDIENTEFSPGVRRMHAIVGQEAPFDHGRQQMKVLAGLEVTTKSVERTAEAIGADIAQREQTEIQKALQLDLPVVAALCANGWNGSSRSEERDGRSAGQDRRSTSPYAESQTGMRLHPLRNGCKTVIASQLKRSGMFWTVRGANAILALRCCHLNGEFEDYWGERRAA